MFKIRNNRFMRLASSPRPFFCGEDNQRIQLKRMLIKVPVPTPQTIVQHYFRLTGRKWRMVSSLLFRFISRARALSWTGRYSVAGTIRNLWWILANTSPKGPCESRNINLKYWCQLFAIERNGSYGNAALTLKKFSLLKSLFEVNLNQTNSLIFLLTGSTTTASAFAILKERSMICIFQAVKSSN